MIPINHPILFQKPSSSELAEKPEDYNKDYVPFPKGNFKTLEAVKSCVPVEYIRMKDQFMVDIDRLKLLSQRLIVSAECDKDIDLFRKKVINDLKVYDKQISSLIAFQNTRYYLHNIVNRTERFLELEAQNPDQTDKFAFNRDGFCAYFVDFLSGIENCLNGSNSRIQGAFISLENSRNPQRELLKIRHGLLEYGVKSFLAKERASGRATYGFGDEVHWYNALYNIACDRFGLEPLIDPGATLGNNTKIIGRLERILPSLMPEFEILNKLTELFYQDLVFALKKRNKEGWLTHPVSIEELKSEIIDGIKDEFITPINLRFKTDNASQLDLQTIIKQCDHGGYEFSESRERLQVWLIDNFLNNAPTANVFTIIGKENNTSSLRDLSKTDKHEDKAPFFHIGSKDNLYFWVFESEIPLMQGANCKLDWVNHQALTLGHLITVDFYSLPKEIRFNLLYHALNNSKPGDFFDFFFNKTISKEWFKMVESDPRLKETMLEKLFHAMNDGNDGETVVRELTKRLNSLSVRHLKEYASQFFNDLICQAFKLKQTGVIDCLFKYGLRKDLTKVSKVEYQRALFSALRSDLEKFKTLYKYSLIDINSKNEQGETLLIAAVKYGQTEFLKELLAHKEIDVNKRDNNGNTALMLAAKIGRTEDLKELLKHKKIRINNQNKNDNTALMLAAISGQTESLNALLKQKEIKVNLRNKCGWTPLMGAARNGHEDCVKVLLEHDVPLISARSKYGNTALMLAAIGGDAGCLSLLLQQNDIDIHKTNNNGKTALMLAAMNGQTECLKVLLKQKAINLKRLDTDGNTVLMLAAANGQTECLKELLAHKEINANKCGKYGVTALMQAAKNGQTECLKELLEQEEIGLNKQDGHGWTALMYAARYGKTECLQALLKRQGIKANRPDYRGCTPLMLAAKHGHENCVQALLEHDHEVINAQDKMGRTALMLAAIGGNECCATLLLQQPNIDINKTDISGKTAWLYATSGSASEQYSLKLLQQIWVAADSGNAALLTELLNSAKALIHVRDKQGLTLAMLAAKSGHVDCLKAILAEKVINVNESNNNGTTPLMLAAENGQTEIVKELLAHNEINVNKRDTNGNTALMLAAKNGQTEVLKELLAHNEINVNKRDTAGNTALMLAAKNGKTKCLEKLLQRKDIELNAQNNAGFTALMYAANNGKTACLKALLKRQGNANLTNKRGWTPLMASARNGHDDCVQELLAQNDPPINAKQHAGYTALMLAAIGKHTLCFKLLLAHPKVNINLKAAKLTLNKKQWANYKQLVA
ncbi:ankyrin repeat domain-containing protein [Salinisphaera sp. G21_0]|uniref:ankyrin repeat domain-containing protein n=1 Tax=Salinisphaera sp. G21_0 TaxID=2821094 RepID=UPI001ADCC91B|nr:ankyrin repeat domain-containing protein [Salinisphaera sp. G21_0]MBO9482806.1 ankyrin repeat domain-containing protein [Salinisphaera sp. G21_0]